jgi:UDP-N-acetylmuramoylalanine-D-glutamate ligase
LPLELSPACASFDMFDDFEQRGNVFKDIVK